MNVYNVQVGLARTKNSTLYTFCSPLPPGKSCFTEITAITPLYLLFLQEHSATTPSLRGFWSPGGLCVATLRPLLLLLLSLLLLLLHACASFACCLGAIVRVYACVCVGVGVCVRAHVCKGARECVCVHVCAYVHVCLCVCVPV